MKSIKAKILEFIALDNQPFSVVGDVDFVEWLSTGTHYQVHYFSDIALPALHSTSFTTYILWNAIWVFACQKRYSSTIKAVQQKSANTGYE